MHQSPIIIFDLDGTLLHTIDDLGYACNHALAACGYPTHDISEYPSLVGNGVNKLIERALPASLKEPHTDLTAIIAQVRTHFTPYYDAHNCDHTHPYDGICALLTDLHQAGFRLAVASNKYQQATQELVTHFFPNTFDAIYGERPSIPRKPDPQIVFDILTALDTPISHLQDSTPLVHYVGDSLVDRDTAANAGVPFYACSWGFVPRQTLVEAGCNTIIDSPAELLHLLP